MLIVIDPTTRTLQVEDTPAPFAVDDFPEGEDLELRVFLDRVLIDVFANDRQSVLTAEVDGGRREQRGVVLGASGRPITFRKLETWPLAPTTAGFHEATRNRIRAAGDE